MVTAGKSIKIAFQPSPSVLELATYSFVLVRAGRGGGLIHILVAAVAVLVDLSY